jgi:hypothetical protein
VPNVIPVAGNFGTSVKVNIETGTFLNVRDGFVTQRFSNLKPGERFDVPCRVSANTKQVMVSLYGVTPTLPPAQQNQLFGDDILLAVHSAKTSSIGEGDYTVFEFTTGGTFAVGDPENGIMRITASGDWTNAGTISGNLAIFSLSEALPQFTAKDKIGHGQVVVLPVSIPSGVSTAEFRLGWREDWGSYPTSDVDLYLVNPSGALNVDGAALNNPEKVVLTNPAPGQWLALIDGFDIPTGSDKFELRVSLDGKVVK